MTLEQLLAVIAVAESGSFSKAAAQLDAAQSTVSRRVMQVESDLELRLFERAAETVTMTEEGKLLFPRFVRMVRLYEKLASLSQSVGSSAREQRISIEQLRSVMAVRETLSFSAAAEKLNFSQAAVSKHVRTFEQQTGVQMFSRRNGSKVAENEEAAELGNVVADLVHRSRSIRRRARELSVTGGGQLRVGIARNLCSDEENKILADFCAENSHVRVKQVGAPLSVVTEMLLDGRLDAMFIKSYDALDGNEYMDALEREREVVFLRILEEKIYVAVSTSNPLAARPELGLRDLQDESIAFLGRSTGVGSAFATFLEACSQANTYPAIYEKDSLEVGVLLRLVGRGEVVALSRGKPETVYPNVTFVPVQSPWTNSWVTLCFLKGAEKGALADFVEHVRGYVREKG